MKFRIKIMLCMVALMALLFGIGGSTLITISFRESLAREQEAAEKSYRLLTRTLRLLNAADLWTDADDAAGSLRELLESEGAVWNGCRLSAGSSETEPIYYSQGGKDRLFSDLHGRMKEGQFTVSFVGNGEENDIQLSGLLTVGEETLYLDVLYDITSVYTMRAQQLRAFSRIFAVLLISCVFLAYLISRFLTRPLTQLSKAANEIASGNLAFRANVDSADEIGVLSRDFDNMAEQVEQSMQTITDSMKRQEEFMGSFSHELKTPMTSIIGYADLMRKQMLTPEENAEAAEYIFSEGKRLESLSLKLLSVFLADRAELTFCAVSPKEMVCELAEHLSRVYAKEFRIRVDTDTEDGRCVLEPDLVRTLLVNLADNARKAIDCEGTITLGCRICGDGCEIWCEDDGRGIPAEALEHLTEAFYRADKSRSRMQGGAGLGLTICEKIAKMHSGSLTIESREGVGTVVTARLKGDVL